MQIDREKVGIAARRVRVDRQPLRIEQGIVENGILDIALNERRPLGGGDSPDAHPRGVGGKLLHAMRDAEINRVGEHPEDHEKKDRSDDGEFDGRDAGIVRDYAMNT